MARFGRGFPLNRWFPRLPVLGQAGPITRRALAANTAASSTSTSSLSVTPTGQVEGDWMLAFVATVGGANTITSASGWTEVGTQVTQATTTTGSLWKKKAGASEAGPYQWDGASARRMGIIVVAYTGADPTDVIDGANVSAEGATAQQLDHDSLTPGAAFDWHILCTCSNTATPDDDAVHFNQPAGYAEQAEISSTHASSANVRMALADRELLDTSATGVASVTIDGGVNRSLVGFEVVIRVPSGDAAAPAEAATGSGVAGAASVDLTATAEQATGSGSAPDAQGGVGAQAEAATGTGAALVATVDLAAQPTAATGTGGATDPQAAITVNAEAATGTGGAFDATVSTETATQAPAEAATGTGAALDPGVAVTAAAEAASGAGTAPDGQGGIGAQAGAASGAGAAQDAAAAITANAGAAAGSGQALDATVSTETITNAPADVAAGTGQALDPGAAVTVNAGVATGTGTANAATGEVGILAAAGSATGVGAALDATVAIGALAALATGTGQALDAEGFVPPPQPPPRWVEGATAASGLAEGATSGSGQVEGVLVGVGVVEGGSSV